MRSRRFTTLRLISPLTVVLAFCALNLNAQSVALVAPNKTDLDKNILSHLRAAYSGAFKVQDLDMTETAFASTGRATDAFNLTTSDARDLAAVLGCDFYILVRSDTQRRAAIGKPDYFEASAAFFAISGRTGRLIKWALASQNGADKNDAEHRLVHS